MNGDQRAIVLMVGFGAAVLMTLFICITYYNTSTWNRTIEQGYSQEVVAGSSSPVWVKKSK
jgi:hypothetical protein